MTMSAGITASLHLCVYFCLTQSVQSEHCDPQVQEVSLRMDSGADEVEMLQTSASTLIHAKQTMKTASKRVATSTSMGHADVDECSKDWLARPEVDLNSGLYSISSGVNVIVDVGGNAGFDIDRFVQSFQGARIFSYEPVPAFAQKLQEKWSHSPNVTILSFGLADSDRSAEFVLDLASSGDSKLVGPIDQPLERVNVQLRDVHRSLEQVFEATGQEYPDVLSVNCEGCEYSVLKRAKDKGWLQKIPYIQMSWHMSPDIANRKSTRCEIEEALRESHEPIWWSDFGWQRWALKGMEKEVSAL
eukprot:gnl/TRDRNA2_/TRDRNA2_174799_c0_seq4.p1 gnl/TRDRNA2_/TRDRNA2_174799_c0~~gnl/TRDRNA2_/TRDRNA2_174799_c0_seq4.p1  ORF type:complete len:302 (-),score=41.77 gnl/TRDRNA2_/TRDRNA2_174799_c0_seq4:473-1378(-)